jgi:hypothetical protein
MNAQVSLTFGQKMFLALDCVPLIFVLGLIALYFSVVQPRFGGPALPLYLLATILILVRGPATLAHLRDLARGVALIEEDRLESFGRAGHHRQSSWGQFAALGRLWMTSGVLLPGRKGHRHRITYSPASRIAWRLEPLD